ncbi:hypothetical protein [Helicobacter didelphidarum]|uniref:hypothetical protein n=1 Tax=Helicobacter didelphidarum TaxID=2040648 RepID=UPI001FE35ED6|nr:hypothetical protein [Helicobacter didelphidarum]
MYQVLEENKPSTLIKSNTGNIVVDKAFMEKESKKHLDNPKLRGMITKEELLSFPKVAKNVESEYNPLHKDYTWKVKADDGNTIVYGSREYEINGKDTNRLLTAHSKTDSDERVSEVDGRGHPHHSIFKDFNFRKSDTTIIPQNPQTNQNLTKDSTDSKQIDFIEKFKEFTSKKNIKQDSKNLSIQQNTSQNKER